MRPDTVYQGDCLEVLADWPAGCVSLCYLDPPYCTQKDWTGTGGAFSDRWAWSETDAARVARLPGPAARALRGFQVLFGDGPMLAYLLSMAERLVEIRRVLADTGSVYLHCDRTSGPQLKLLLDAVFGGGNFRNQIVWCYTKPSTARQRNLAHCHDTIFWYSCGPEWTFNPDPIRQPYAARSAGRLQYKMRLYGAEPTLQRMHPDGVFPFDWCLIHKPKGNSAEWRGYPTQKPERLLERIVAAGGEAGGVFLDPYCGSGTSLVVARRLGLRPVGIDISPDAVRISRDRLAGTVPNLL